MRRTQKPRAWMNGERKLEVKTEEAESAISDWPAIKAIKARGIHP